ncbi:MAG: HIT family protein [bacterium]
MDCIFCKIVRRELPSSIVYEDDLFMAFLDIHPTVKGHVLIMPKEHYPKLDETPEELVGSLFQLVARLAPVITHGAGAEGYNIGVNNGTVAGQVITHTHVHILPRRGDDNKSLWESSEYSPGELEQYWQVIKESVENNQDS